MTILSGQPGASTVLGSWQVLTHCLLSTTSCGPGAPSRSLPGGPDDLSTEPSQGRTVRASGSGSTLHTNTHPSSESAPGSRLAQIIPDYTGTECPHATYMVYKSQRERLHERQLILHVWPVFHSLFGKSCSSNLLLGCQSAVGCPPPSRETESNSPLFAKPEPEPRKPHICHPAGQSQRGGTA